MLVRELVERQKEMGLSDGAFARLLKVPPGTWGPTRYGHRRAGVRVARAALRAFAQDAVIQALAVALLLTDRVDEEGSEELVGSARAS